MVACIRFGSETFFSAKLRFDEAAWLVLARFRQGVRPRAARSAFLSRKEACPALSKKRKPLGPMLGSPERQEAGMGTKTDAHVKVRANGGEHNEGRCSTKARMARAQNRIVAERAAARRAEEAFERAHICEDGVEFFDLEEWERTVLDMAGVCPWPEDGEDPWGEEDGFDCEERGCSSDLAGHPWDCPCEDCEEAGEPLEGSLGDRGEEAACELLKRRGYIILERNWTCVAGEADIVARDEDGTLVFVEVKTRSSLKHGLPSEAVTPKKRARYERIAGYFLADYDGMECRVRFDVISILALPNGRALVRHYINAFGTGC